MYTVQTKQQEKDGDTEVGCAKIKSETATPCQEKQREQMALKEKQLMKENEGDKGGENSITAPRSGLAERQSGLIFNVLHIFKIAKMYLLL